jgi:antitoxin MazE
MKSQLVKWGNSTAIRIPKDVLSKAGMQEGDIVEFGAKKGVVLAKLVKNRFKLSELVEGITPDNIHEETDSGEAEGNESW